MKDTKLNLSVGFYSVQGEGPTTGVPSYFIRLKNCNLSCGISKQMMRDIRKAGEEGLEDGEVIEGDLVTEGKATWTCDSISQWAIRGKEQDHDYLINEWKREGIYDDVRKGVVHLIWTGGEPTMKNNAKSIISFLDYWKSTETNPINEYNEIETNGTLLFSDELFEAIDQINCSPKLANSGMTEKRRISSDTIKQIMTHPNYNFKFVISSEEDVQEMFRDFIAPFNIPLQNVCCMPGLDDQKDYHERTQFVMEMAKKYRFRGLSRAHISAWDKTLNV